MREQQTRGHITGRKVLHELLFWILLLGADAIVLYLIHRSFGQPWNYKDTMPVVLPVGAFVPLLAAVLRYFPKKRIFQILGIAVSLALSIMIAQVTLNGFYGDSPFIIEAIYGKGISVDDLDGFKDVLGTIYEDGTPTCGEISLMETIGKLPFKFPEYRGVRRNVQKAENYVQLRIICRDGTERTLHFFDAGRKHYVEEPGVGVWSSIDYGYSEYEVYKQDIIRQEYNDAFMKPIIAGEPPTLSPYYNGEEKAVWVDWSKEDLEEKWADSFEMQPSWTYHFEDHMPEAYVSERACDVRWVFLKKLKSSEYLGFWYDVKTGKSLRNAYKNTFHVVVYDLVMKTGEELDEGESPSINECLFEYFGLPNPTSNEQ